MSNGAIDWPCGCRTWRDGSEFKLRWCGDRTCKVYRTAIRQSKARGNEIRYEIGGPDANA